MLQFMNQSRLNCLPTSPTDLELVMVKISLDHLFLLCRVHLPSNSFPANDNKVIAYLDSIASASHIVFLGDFSFQISVGHHLQDPNLSPRPSVIRLLSQPPNYITRIFSNALQGWNPRSCFLQY